MIIFSTKKEVIGMAALVLFAVFGLGELVVCLYSLHPDLSGRKDFTMEYLMGKALLNGVDPYLPLSELRELFPIPYDPKLHPPTHPPAMALVGLPLALVSYTWAAVIWFAIELALIFSSCYLLLRYFGFNKSFLSSILIVLSLFLWHPMVSEFVGGQLNTLLLLLLTIAWMQLRNKNNISGGIFLGLAVAIKLLSWPIALFLLMRRNWLAFITTATSVFIVNMVAMALMGFEPVWRYYTTTSSMLTHGWGAHSGNFSIWTLGRRLFEGTSINELASRGLFVDLISPIYFSSNLSKACSLIIQILFLVFSMSLALRAKNFDFAFGILVCSSILFSPIMWSHYLIMALLPIAFAIIALSFAENGGENHRLIYFAAMISGVLLVAPETTWGEFMYLFETKSTVGPNGVTYHHIPFTVGLLTLIPLAALLTLMWLLWLLDNKGIHIDRMKNSSHIEE